MSVSTPYCITCKFECGSHNCKICHKPCHAIEPCCVIKHGEEHKEVEEGFGAAVTCKECYGKGERAAGAIVVEVEAEQVSKKSTSDNAWWKKRKSDSSGSLDVKKKVSKVTKPVSEKKQNYKCIECFSLVLNGSRQENTCEIYRNNASSIQRHKDRWHNKDNKKCTFVPDDSKEIIDMRKKAKHNVRVEVMAEENVSSTASNRDDNVADNIPPEVDYESESGYFDNSEVDTSHSSKQLQSTLLNMVAENPKNLESSSASIDDVMTAISNMNIKLDKIGGRYATMEKEYFEQYDKSTKLALENIKKAENIHDLNLASDGILEFFYNEESGESVLRCNPCYRLHIASKPALCSTTPSQAVRILCKSGNGNLATGLLLNKKKTNMLIEGHNESWYHQKSQLLEHIRLIGEGSSVHKKALEACRKEQKIGAEARGIVEKIFRAVITDLKLGAAGMHLETLLAFLSECSVNIGQIGHSRKHLPNILHCIEKAVNRRVGSFLSSPLPSTHLPPFFWVTCDKGTPARTTNQAILIVARDSTGEPCPIPVDAPKVYTDVTVDGTYAALATMITTSIKNNFGESVLSRLAAVSADGPYQTSSFRRTLMEILKLHDDRDLDCGQLSFPASWDSAHNVNLGVTDILKDTGLSGSHLNRFIERCNVFNTILSRGKGYACLQQTEEDFLRPISFAKQRFASSSFTQWTNIEKSYASYWKAFELLYPVRIEEEEYQYKIAGYDFVLDLLAFLDTLEPVVDLMLHSQSLDSPIWKLRSWWPAVRRQMESRANGKFPRIDAVGEVRSGTEYKGVQLLDGWLFHLEENTGTDKVFTWRERELDDVKTDHVRFANDLLRSVDTRVEAITSGNHIKILQVFDASSLLELHCGKCDKRDLCDGDYDEYGVIECKKVLSVLNQHKHLSEFGMNFDPRLAHRYMLSLKDAVGLALFQGHCQSWFRDQEDNLINLNGASITELSKVDSDSLFESMFTLKFSDGREDCYRLHEQSFYSSFYADKNVYMIAKPHSCAILDFALSKGGPEAIAESFYSTMRAQLQTGGQGDDVLVKRTKLSWCLPSLKNCRAIIEEAGKTYIDGDDVVKPHKVGTFFSGRSKGYSVSKVVDRVHSDSGRCPFLC